MGFGDRRANFLGHGVGLQIDDLPVIAEGFDEPLAENMVLALEPKKGIAGIGMVGIEDTFIVTPEGGRSITGSHSGLIAGRRLRDNRAYLSKCGTGVSPVESAARLRWHEREAPSSRIPETRYEPCRWIGVVTSR